MAVGTKQGGACAALNEIILLTNVPGTGHTMEDEQNITDLCRG
jgi:hypothetical protein